MLWTSVRFYEMGVNSHLILECCVQFKETTYCTNTWLKGSNKIQNTNLNCIKLLKRYVKTGCSIDRTADDATFGKES